MAVRIRQITIAEFTLDGPFRRLLSAYARSIVTDQRKALRHRENAAGAPLGWAPGTVGKAVAFKLHNTGRSKRQYGRIVPRGTHDGDPKRSPPMLVIAISNTKRKNVNFLALSVEILARAKKRAELLRDKLIAEKKIRVKLKGRKVRVR